MTELHVVLGASGGAGRAVVRELVARGKRVRAVTRAGALVPGAESARADAASPESVRDAVRGASVVYHCINVPYQQWARRLFPIADAIIEAAAAAGAKLVVMDNLYMYGRVSGPMTERTPRQAQGKKGRLRAALERHLLEAHRSGKARLAIGRASDFLGPQARSATMLLVVEPALAGRPASWLGTLDAPHTVSYLPDVGWGLATLGEREEAFGEVWHLPAGPPLTGRQLIEMVFQELGRPARMKVISRPMMLAAGLFSSGIREAIEVLYQFEHPFVMDATKFSRAFGSRVTPHRDAVRQTIEGSRGPGAPR
ncbi:MAG TPA: NAD(P)H-binding protein [bacterium]|nr:NAD(P)H-binding protein [bacterium]